MEGETQNGWDGRKLVIVALSCCSVTGGQSPAQEISKNNNFKKVRYVVLEKKIFIDWFS